MKKLKIKNILLVSSDDISKEKYYYILLKKEGIYYEKSPLEFDSLLTYKLKYENNLYLFKINLLTIKEPSKKQDYHGIIEIYNSIDSFEFLEEFESNLYKNFGYKLFPTLRINLGKESINKESNFPIVKINEKNDLTSEKWDEIFYLLIKEFNKDKNDEFPYNKDILSKNINNRKDICNDNLYENKDNKIKILTKQRKKLIHISLFLLFLFSLFNLLILYYDNEYTNTELKHDNILFNSKYILQFLSFYLIKIVIYYLYKYDEKNKKKTKLWLISIFIFSCLIIILELINIFSNYNSLNNNKNYHRNQFIGDILLTSNLVALFVFIKI